MKKILFVLMLVMAFTVGNAFADVDANADANANVNGISASSTNDQVFEAGDRSFANQGIVQYGVLPGYFGENSKPGHQFIPLRKLMMYTTEWKILEHKPSSMGSDFNYTPYHDKVPAEEQSKSVIVTTEVFDTEKVTVDMLAFGTMNATDEDTISSDLLSRVLNAAAEYGATHVQFTAEGTNTELQSSGWGIGLSYTKATDSSVSTGGTGYSQGKAGYQNLPWLQFMFLKVTGPESATIEADPTEAKSVASGTGTDAQVEKAIQNSTIK